MSSCAAYDNVQHCGTCALLPPNPNQSKRDAKRASPCRSLHDLLPEVYIRMNNKSCPLLRAPSAQLNLLHDLLYVFSETASWVSSIDSRATGIVTCSVDCCKHGLLAPISPISLRYIHIYSSEGDALVQRLPGQEHLQLIVTTYSLMLK